METRAEHLEWCKKRALEYVDRGDTKNAWASMVSDLSKHPETRGHIAVELGSQMFAGGMLSSTAEMRRFIEGFN